MLYDPKWQKKATTKPSYKGFIQWLEQQDPNTTYNWFDEWDCVVARYLTAVTGNKRPSLEWSYASLFPSKNHYVAMTAWSLTYGEVLERARAMQ